MPMHLVLVLILFAGGLSLATLFLSGEPSATTTTYGTPMD
jgi:hypothetical protein